MSKNTTVWSVLGSLWGTISGILPQQIDGLERLRQSLGTIVQDLALKIDSLECLEQPLGNDFQDFATENQ